MHEEEIYWRSRLVKAILFLGFVWATLELLVLASFETGNPILPGGLRLHAILLAMSLCLSLGVLWTHLSVVVVSAGIKFRFFPLCWGGRLVRWSEIQEIKICLPGEQTGLSGSGWDFRFLNKERPFVCLAFLENAWILFPTGQVAVWRGLMEKGVLMG